MNNISQNTAKELWCLILVQLRKEVHQIAIETFLADIEPIKYEDGHLTIKSPDEYKAQIVRDRFADKITLILYNLLGGDVYLHIVSKSEDENKNVANLPLPEDYIFDKFIVGNSNRFAHAAAVSVSQHPGSRTYNPLFIYGKPGLGKTHLLLAIGHEIKKTMPNKRIVYIKGEDFVNEMIESLKNHTADSFRGKYRNTDLFLVDDIQFIAGKESSQEEFFHTFNSIYEAGNQIVITSDRKPSEMNLLEERLKSRFEGGMMADIQPPDYDTRMAIIRNKASIVGIDITNDAVEYVAAKVTANVRQLEGVIKRSLNYAEEGVITKDTVIRVVEELSNIGEEIPSAEKIICEVSNYFNVDIIDLRGINRSKNIAQARHAAMYLMKNLRHMTLKEIGAEFNGRDHTTVLSAINKMEELMKTDPALSNSIRDISAEIFKN